MAMTRYVALLRGINVGGKNIIKMVDLQACFEDADLREVSTYIQSGNVLFASTLNRAVLSRRIATALLEAFEYSGSVVLRSQRQLSGVIERAPAGFGERPDAYKYDVAFLMDTLKASRAIEQVVTKPGVDKAWAGTGVLYLSRLTSKATQSKLRLLAASRIYQSMTVRNWNTTTKLLARMGHGAE